MLHHSLHTTSAVRLIAAATLLLGMAACGDREPEQQRTVTPADTTYDTFGGGPPGGTLVVLADREPDQLNPLTFSSNAAYHPVHLMFRALAVRDTTLSAMQPDLAASWAMADDSTLVIELRPGVQWHDGVPVTADDVVFTIERQADPRTASPRQADVAAVASATARDSLTVVVDMKRAGPYAVNAILEVMPVPRHLLESVSPADMRNSAFGRNPVGNGFYRFGTWTAGRSLQLHANEQRPDRASIDRIIMRFLPDMNSAITELLAGEGDLIAKLPPEQYARVNAADHVVVYNGPRVRPAWIAWNTRRAPLDDVRVRRALLMAVNRAEIATALFGDVGEAAYSPIPPAMREHSPDVQPLPYDTATARDLLAEAGWTDTNRDGVLDRNGQPLRIEVDYISTDPTRRDVLVAMQSMLREIGVALVPRAYESTAWVTKLREGDFMGSFWGWGWGPSVAGSNAEMIFHSRSVPPGGPNFAGSGSPRMDALIDSTLVQTDTARARAIWSELEQLMIDDAVYAPIYMDPELFALHARFRNVRFRGIEWTEDLPYWYIPVEERLPRDRTR